MATKVQNIPLGGITTSPSDFSSPDGALAAAINLHHDLGALTNPIQTTPELLSILPTNSSVVYVHCNDNYRHLIIKDGDGKHYYIDITNSIPSSISISSCTQFVNIQNVKAICCIGNIVIFYTENGAEYYRWKNSAYVYIGGKLPELNMTFGIDLHTFCNHSSSIDGGGSADKEYPATDIDKTYFKFSNGSYEDSDKTDAELLTETSRKTINESALAEANLFTNSVSKKGMFSQPFFVRYAYRLYDGSTIMESSPILIRPASGHNPIIIGNEVSYATNDATPWVKLYGFGFAGYLRYMVSQQVDLSNWTDIIKSVCIYVTPPIYTYKQSSKEYQGSNFLQTKVGSIVDTFYGISKEDVMHCKVNTREEAVCQRYKINEIFADGRNLQVGWTDDGAGGRSYEYTSYYTSSDKATWESHNTYEGSNHVAYVRRLVSEDNIILALSDYGNGRSYYKKSLSPYSCASYVNLEYLSADEMKDAASLSAVFRLVKEIDINDFVQSSTGTLLDLSKDELVNINTLEQLKESYDSHATIIPSSVRVYNNRVNTFDFKKIFYKGHTPFTMSQICKLNASCQILYAVYINEDSQQYVVASYGTELFTSSAADCFVFYPDINATRIEIYKKLNTGNVVMRSIQLKQHDFLNGAFAITSINEFVVAKTDSNIYQPTSYNGKTLEEIASILTSGNNYKYYRNEIRTSNTNNPFTILAENVEQVGNGKIIALVPQAIALGQGQFGQYPMSCFTTDGIWALSPNATGGWAAKQPVSRDVVLNEDSGNILQLDREIIFSTNRGLMLMSGSNVQCISEVFDGLKDSFFIYNEGAMGGGYPFIADSVLKKTIICDISSVRTDLFPQTDVSKFINLSFKDFIGNAVMLWDYAHQRIIIGNPGYPISFVFNKDDKQWTTILQCITSSVNSYPQCYAMTKKANGQNLFVDFSRSFTAESKPIIETTSTAKTKAVAISLPTTGFLMTRPIKLGDSVALKTLRTINVQGKFQRSHVDIVLLGSADNNLQNWYLLSSCKGSRMAFHYGTPFKFFRVCLITHLDCGESVSSITIEYEVKDNNKLRQ